MSEKTKGQLLSEELVYKKTSSYMTANDEEKSIIFSYAKEYMSFLNAAKTEREAVNEGIRLAEVSDGVYLLNAAPLNLSGADGSPCRAILIADR